MEKVNLPLILSIVGVFLTVFIYFLGKRFKYPGQITFILEDWVRIFNSIIKEFPEINIQFKGKPINEQIVLVKGYFLNSGNKDITKEMVIEKLCVSLPEGAKWLKAKITSNSSKVKSLLAFNENKLNFDLGLFRRNEFLGFEALMELPLELSGESKTSISKNNPHEMLILDHRIADVEKVTRLNRREDYSSRGKFFSEYIFGPMFGGIMFLVLGLGVYTETYFYSFESTKIGYFIEVDGKDLEVDLKLLKKGFLQIEAVDGDFNERITLKEFVGKYKTLKTKEIKEKNYVGKSIVTFLFLLMILLFFGIFGLIFEEISSYRKCRKLLEN